MAITIRLCRMGAKKKPFYRIVVAESQRARTGKYLENVGTYNPLKSPAEIVLKEDKIIGWLKQGAQPSDTVRSILVKQANMQPYLAQGA